MKQVKTAFVVVGMVGVVAAAFALIPSNIDPDHKFSWSENAGWMNWRDADGTNEGVVVGADFLSGYLWSENAGWINVGDGDGPYGNATGLDFGVNVLASGDLDGFAWSENIGWVNFGWAAAANPDRPRLDSAAGRFRGWAWSENAGWIKLDDATHFVAFSFCPASSAPQPELGISGDGSLVTAVKNRYVSILAGDAGRSQAIRVRFVSLPPPFDVWEHGHPQQVGPGDYFVGEPFQVCENGGEVLFSCTGGICSNPPNNACSTDVDCCGAAGPLPRNWFWAAPLVCDKGAAHFMDWHGECDGGTCVGGLLKGDNCALDEDCVDVVHLFHEGFVPDGVYDVQVVDSSCSLQEESSYSTPLSMTQGVWGDLCSDGPGGACTGVADGNPEVIQDVLGLIDKFQNINALQKSRADLVPSEVDFKVTIIGDALFALDAFQGFSYPFTPGDPCAAGLTSGQQ